MTTNPGQKVVLAAQAVKENIEKATDEMCAKLHAASDSLGGKLKRAEEKLLAPLREAEAVIDELLFDGDNGGDQVGPATFLPAADSGLGATAGAVSEAQPSTLATPVPLPAYLAGGGSSS